MSTIQEIQETIDREIAPAIALHKGFCKAESFHDGLLGISLTGGCVGCPSSQITLYNGVVPILMEHHTDILDVFLV